MMIKQICLFVLILFCLKSLAGQCPARDFLWRRIIYLRDSSQVSPADQLAELKGYLKNMDNCPYRNDSTHALLLLRIGWLQGLQNDFNEAIRYTNLSIQMIHDHVHSKNINEAHLIKSYNNLSYLYDSTGENILSRRASDSCIAISLRLKTGYDYTFSHIESKIAYLFSKGDFYDCMYYTDIGDYVLKKSGYPQNYIYDLLAWKINALLFLKKYTEASTLIDKSISEIQNNPDQINLGTFLGLKALVEAETGNQNEAIRATYQSVALNKKFGNNTLSAGVLNNLGYNLYFKKLRQYENALKLYQEALKYADNNYAVSIFTNIANAYVAKIDFGKADLNYQNAFRVIGPEANETSLQGLPAEKMLIRWNAEYIITLMLDRAESFIIRFKLSNQKKDIDSAIAIYKSADRLMNKIKLSQSDISSKLFWRTNTRRLYEHAIESAYLADNMSAAFYFFEKSRAVLLNDQLKEQQTEDPGLMEMASVRKKLRIIENQLAVADTRSPAYNNLRRSVFLEKENLNTLALLIQERNPWYYQSLLDTNMITLQSVQSNLLHDQRAVSMMEFFNGDSNVYTLLIRDSTCQIKKIDKSDFDALTDQYTAYLSNPARENKEYEDFSRISNQLYGLIFKNIAVPEGRIIISPDGKYFPFEPLIVDRSSNEYFLFHHTVSYTYSIRYLINDFKKTNSKTVVDFLGIAPVQYPDAFHLTSLDNSDVSLKKINAAFNQSDLFIRTAASKENFMLQFPSHKIIQLYTHSSGQHPNGEPVIFFADSALYLSEILPEQKVNTQLIVLSACETGNGNVYQGEGVFSFNRGFASIGIPSAVINLWSVDNVSTYTITELFYKYVTDGMDLDVAMQKAKLDFIAQSSKEKKLPYYWAASVVVGKTNAVQIEKTRHWNIVLYILIGILILLLLKSWGYRLIRFFKIINPPRS